MRTRDSAKALPYPVNDLRGSYRPRRPDPAQL